MAKGSTISITFKMDADSKSFQNLVNDSEGLKKALNGAVVEADRLPKAFGSKLTGVLSNVTKSVGAMAAGFMSFRAIMSGIQSAVGTMKDFERANSELASVLGTNIEGVGRLSEAAVALGGSTEASASEVTALQTALARLGFSESQILSMEESVLKFASAVGTDLASAADFTGSALRSFGMSASQSKVLLDMMAKSTSASALSFEKLQTSIAIVGPVANTFGISARDTVALLGAMSNAGFDASSAATALRNILLNLADSNGKLAKGLGHTAKTMPEIISALQELRDRGVDLATTLDMTDKKSVSAFNTMISGVDTVKDLYDALGDANGALDEMYNTMTNNLEGSIKSLSSAWEGFILQMRGSTGVIKTVVDGLTDLVHALTSAASGNGSFHSYYADKQTQKMADKYKEQLREVFEMNGPGVDIVKLLEEKLNEMMQADTKGLTYENGYIVKRTERLGAMELAYEQLIEEINRATEATDDFNNASSVSGVASPTSGSGEGKKGKGTDIISQIKAEVAAHKDEFDALQDEAEEYNTLSNNMVAALLASKGITAQYDAQTQALVNMGYAAAAQVEVTETAISNASKSMKTSQDAVNAITSALGDMSRAIDGNASSWLQWISNVISAIAQAIPAISALATAKKAEATANAAAAATGGASSVASIPYVGPVLAVAAVASILASLANLPKFAKGGIAYGPTLGLFGEYAGAANNPEVVAPLDKLRSIIETPSSGYGQVEFKIEGRTLKGVLQRVDNLDRRS